VTGRGARSGRGARILRAALLAAGALGVVGATGGAALWVPGGSGALGLAGVAVAALAGAALGWAAGRARLARQAEALGAAARGLAHGEPSARGATGPGPGSLRPVARALDDLARELQAVRARAGEAEGGRRGLDARAPGRLDGEGDAVVAANHLQRVALFNRGAERLFGYQASEVVGQPLDVLLPPETPAGRRPHVRDLATTGERRELAARHRDGRLFPVEAAVSARSRDGATAFTIVLRDMTERRRSEAELRESEARFRGAFEHSAAGMALLTPEGAFLRVNRALCEMLGYPERELLALRHDALSDPDDVEPAGWRDRNLRTGSIRWYQQERRYRHRDGRVVWGLVSVSAVGASPEEMSDLLLQVHDITERKRAQELEEQLRQAQKIEAIGRLAAGVAHDFNNLLMVITGRGHILLHRLGRDHPLRRHVELIQDTALRAGALTRQLLAFSRKQVPEPALLDLSAVLLDMAPMLQRLIGEEIALAVEPGRGLGRVRADRSQVEQVVMNLVVNARDAMPEGGRLTLETRETALDEAFAASHPGARPGPCVALAVRDTGVGMDAATCARLFEPFFTTKGPGKGTGLGLATVYGIIKQSGGYIDVDSAPGRGSAFTVYLPRAEAAAPAPPPEADRPPLESLRGVETVLLVEDEEAVRDLACEVLQQAGYTVLGARHGGEALLLSDRHPGPIHLLLTDVVMPELGGRELARRLTVARPELRVALMSGYSDETLEAHGVLGAPGFLRKPITPEALLRSVREVLAGGSPRGGGAS
jgi:PAS domain S-box-containing protein